MRTLARPFLIALATAAVTVAQQDKLPKWKIDPYTKMDPEAMAKAGYVSFGPFDVGTIGEVPTPTTQIEDTMQYVRILWIETEHFRLGSNLPEWTIPMDLKTRKKIRAELEELAEKLPRIKTKTRRLDPWLRAHLYAHRLEKLYTELQGMFGVTDEDFPPDPNNVLRVEGARYMGYGPYLGMKDKYNVLLWDKMASHRLYLSTFIGRNTKFPQRWHFKEPGSLMFSTATDCNEGKDKHDTALHCSVAFNISQLCLSGFRYYSYDLPVWIREGLGHYMCRRVDPKWPNYDQQEGGIAELRKQWKWAPYVRNLVVTKGKYAPFAEVMKWRNFGDIKFNDHTAIWSRMDWMMSQGHDKFSKFLFIVKGRVDKNWYPDQADLVGATRDALREAYGITPLNFDTKWGEWVRQTYPSK